MALEGVIAQCYPIALLLVTHSVPKKISESDFLYYCAIGYAMTAFEQAWALLKSNQLKDDEYWYNKIQEDYGEGGRYDDMPPSNQSADPPNETINPHHFSIPPAINIRRPPVRDSFRFNRQTMLPIEGAKGFDIDAFLRRKLPTPLEERVADRPPISHIEWNPNTNKYTLRGTGDEELSTLKPGMPMGQSPFPEGDMTIHGYLGATPEQFRRKDYYRKLLTGLLNAGISIDSDDRNRESNTFHQKFLDNLPPNLEAIKNSDASGKIGYFDPIHYRRKPLLKPNSELFEELGKTKRMRVKNKPEIAIALSDLARRDYGALPIRSLPMEPVREPIGTRQTKLDEFRPPPPPERHIFEQLLSRKEEE